MSGVLGGVVLAGGRSRRMGRDKALLDWDGEPLVARVTRRIAAACEPVLIASGDGTRLGMADEIPDAIADAGPLSGLLAALERADGPVAAVAVDMPHANGAVLAALAATLGGAAAAVPLVAGRLQPLHAVYRRELAAPLRAYLERGGRSVLGFIDEIHVRPAGADVWGAADPHGHFAVNVNRMGDVADQRGSSSGSAAGARPRRSPR